MKIQEYKKNNGATVYRTQIYLGVDQFTGKKVKASITGKTKTEVKQKAKRKQDDFIKNGNTVLFRARAETFSELLALWFDTYKPTVKLQSYKQMRTIANVHILPQLGEIKLKKLSTPLLQNYVNKLVSSPYKQYSLVISIVKRILNYGVSLQLIQSNPMLSVIVPKIRRNNNQIQTIKYIDSESLSKFLTYLDRLKPTFKNHYDTTLYKFLLATGCRFGEASALEWSDIDLDSGTVNITKSYSRIIDKVDTPKSKASIREISIDQATCRLLRLYRMRQRQIFLEAGMNTPTVVFATPLRTYAIYCIRQGVLDKHCRNAGIKRFTFHAFRHTHASLLLNAGISYKELQQRLGHTKISMTLDTYSHLSKEKEKEAVSFYEKALKLL